MDPTQNPDNAVVRATYLGVKDYGASETTKENVDHFQYRFLVDGEEKTFAIDNSAVDAAGKPLYPIQNKLKERYDYQIRVVDDLVLEADEVTSESDNVFEPVVAGNPGEKTVLNFIKTALMPVGTTLYVYGGGWDWQDEGSAVQARTIGVSPDWIRFFEIQDVNYTFRTSGIRRPVITPSAGTMNTIMRDWIAPASWDGRCITPSRRRTASTGMSAAPRRWRKCWLTRDGVTVRRN